LNSLFTFILAYCFQHPSDEVHQHLTVHSGIGDQKSEELLSVVLKIVEYLSNIQPFGLDRTKMKKKSENAFNCECILTFLQLSICCL